MDRHPVTFEPSGATAWVEAGSTVLAAARAAGVLIEATCGGRGVCGSCGVRVLDGRLSDPDAEETAGLTRAPRGTRLACRARVTGPVRVRPLIAARTSIGATALVVEGTPLVVGVDLGTTNVNVVAVDLRSGREVGRAAVPNRQASFGADVLSRVSAAIEGHAAELARAGRDSVAEAVGIATGGHPGDVRVVVIAGNSAMAALVTGTDVSPLGAAPYAAPDVPRSLDPSLVGGLSASTHVWVVPPLASFVGGDVLAGLHAVGAAWSVRPTLLVDVGTNAEVALWDQGVLWVTSAAAGPAFDGVAGMSGSEFISTVAGLVRDGVVAPDGLLDPHADGVESGDGGVRHVRVHTGGEERRISQVDLRALQLAKAAVRVAIGAVVRAAGLPADALGQVAIAGAFGGALDAADLVSIGMVPEEFEGRVSSAGNTSLSGAVALALADVPTPDTSLFARLRHVDLASDPAFATELMRAVELAPYRL